MDIQTLGMIAAGVVLVVVVLYIWDRRTRQQPVDVVDATKLAVGSGAIAGGIAYALGGEGGDLAEAVTRASESLTQEMFVGKPEF